MPATREYHSRLAAVTVAASLPPPSPQPLHLAISRRPPLDDRRNQCVRARGCRVLASACDDSQVASVVRGFRSQGAASSNSSRRRCCCCCCCAGNTASCKNCGREGLTDDSFRLERYGHRLITWGENRDQDL